jgi:hypothetical protein
MPWFSEARRTAIWEWIKKLSPPSTILLLSYFWKSIAALGTLDFLSGLIGRWPPLSAFLFNKGGIALAAVAILWIAFIFLRAGKRGIGFTVIAIGVSAVAYGSYSFGQYFPNIFTFTKLYSPIGGYGFRYPETLIVEINSHELQTYENTHKILLTCGIHSEHEQLVDFWDVRGMVQSNELTITQPLRISVLVSENFMKRLCMPSNSIQCGATLVPKSSDQKMYRFWKVDRRVLPLPKQYCEESAW